MDRIKLKMVYFRTHKNIVKHEVLKWMVNLVFCRETKKPKILYTQNGLDLKDKNLWV